MKDLGETKFILGIQVERNRKERTLCINQSEYIKKVLKRYNMNDCKKIDTPLNASIKLSKQDSPKTEKEKLCMSKFPYQSAVGAIMYAMLGTRPDIAFSITALSQFSSNPGYSHWMALKHLLRYLKGTINYKIKYDGSLGSSIVGYCDSDWGNGIDDRRSITGYVFTIAGGAVSWQSKKQPTVALSSVEAEYMASSHAAREALSWKSFLYGLGYHDILKTPLTIYSDSQGSIALTKNPEHHSRTKHIDVQHHFIRELVLNQKIVYEYKPTDVMVADMLTKVIGRDQHKHLVNMIGIGD